MDTNKIRVQIVISLVTIALSIWFSVRDEKLSFSQKETKTLHVYNLQTGKGLAGVTKRILDTEADTNRTIWETVQTPHIHAGLERIEAGAEIPFHSHQTDELLLIFSGIGAACDANGDMTELTSGSMVYVKKHSRHSFKNLGDTPLLLMWSFPMLTTKEQFKFHQNYIQTR